MQRPFELIMMLNVRLFYSRLHRFSRSLPQSNNLYCVHAGNVHCIRDLLQHIPFRITNASIASRFDDFTQNFFLLPEDLEERGMKFDRGNIGFATRNDAIAINAIDFNIFKVWKRMQLSKWRILMEIWVNEFGSMTLSLSTKRPKTDGFRVRFQNGRWREHHLEPLGMNRSISPDWMT